MKSAGNMDRDSSKERKRLNDIICKSLEMAVIRNRSCNRGVEQGGGAWDKAELA
jgi:hypothetical protein